MFFIKSLTTSSTELLIRSSHHQDYKEISNKRMTNIISEKFVLHFEPVASEK